MAVGALVRVTDVSCVLVVFGRVALARMVSASLVQVKGPGNQGYINWVRPGDCGKGCSAHVPLARRRGAGALTTNWAGNFRRALGCVDTAVYFRNKLRSGSSGETQVGVPTMRQSTPWGRAPDLGVRDVAGSQARVVALVCRRTFGGHPDAERCPALRAGHRAVGRWDGTVLRTKVQGARSRVPCGHLCATDGAPLSDGRLALRQPAGRRECRAVRVGVGGAVRARR